MVTKKDILEDVKKEKNNQENTRTFYKKVRKPYYKKKRPSTPLQKPTSPLKVISLGGLEEIGKNMTVFEYEDNILIVDCGVSFPGEDLLGVDLVIPDFTYLEKNKEKIKGIVITHGHEDHIGGIPYLLKQFNIPLYCTKLTGGIINYKIKEFPSLTADIHIVNAGDITKIGCFSIEWIHVNHSIPDSCALSISTPVGKILHTGDFKIDNSPIDGRVTDLTRIGNLGKEGVLLMLSESTNAERPGFTPSERVVGTTFTKIFEDNKDRRVIISTFSSNVHRVQQIIDAAVRYKRKVCVSGRSMVNILRAAQDLGYISVPEGVLVDINEINKFKPSQLCLITTGSQGEPMSALYRMVFGEHDRLTLSYQDVVVLSSHPIPGNERTVNKIINELKKRNIRVVDTGTADVHVSGHACQEELKLILGLVKPQFFMPIHGESRHLSAHKELASSIGIGEDRVLISSIGKVVELTQQSIKFNGTVPSGAVYVDGSGVGDVGATIIRERTQLSQDGVVVVYFAYDHLTNDIVNVPDFEIRGFVYSKDSEELLNGARATILKALNKYTGKRRKGSNDIKVDLKDTLQKYFYSKTKKRPVIIPVVLEV